MKRSLEEIREEKENRLNEIREEVSDLIGKLALALKEVTIDDDQNLGNLKYYVDRVSDDLGYASENYYSSANC